MGTLLVLLETPQRIRFNKFCFTIFRANVCKILISEWILFVGNPNKLEKLGLGGNIGFGTLNVFTLGSTTLATLVIIQFWCIPTFVLSMLNMHCTKGHSSIIWPNFLNRHKFLDLCPKNYMTCQLRCFNRLLNNIACGLTIMLHL